MNRPFLLVARTLIARYWAFGLLFLLLLWNGGDGDIHYVTAVVFSLILGRTYNLNRVTQHWRTLPISFSSWLLGSFLAVGLLFALPIAIKIIWTLANAGFNDSVAWVGAVEAGASRLFLCFVSFAVSALCRSVIWLLVFVVTTLVIGYWSSNILIPDVDEGSSWPELHYVRDTASWGWIMGLLIALSVPIWLKLASLQKRNGWAIAGLAITVGVLPASFMWAIESRSGPVTLSGGLNVQVLSGTKASVGQKIFSDLSVSGLHDGSYLELNNIEILDMDNDRQIDVLYQRNDGSPDDSNYGWLAASQIRYDDSWVLGGNSWPSSGFFYGWSYANDSSQSVADRFDLELDQSVKVRLLGGVFSWSEVGRVPFDSGTYTLDRDMAMGLELKMGDQGVRTCLIEMRSPLLSSSGKETRYPDSTICKGPGYVVLVAYHAELQEQVFLKIEMRATDSWSGRNRKYRQHSFSFELMPDPRWQILWSDEEDTLGKWLAGAELVVYTPEFQGAVDQTVSYPN